MIHVCFLICGVSSNSCELTLSSENIFSTVFVTLVFTVFLAMITIFQEYKHKIISEAAAEPRKELLVAIFNEPAEFRGKQLT